MVYNSGVSEGPMSVDHNKPGLAFWATVVPGTLFMALVVYELSFGPAVWLFAKLGRPAWLGSLIDVAPDPLEWIINHCPGPAGEWLSKMLYGYYEWWFDMA
jgi:hypothetical protein